MAALAAIIENSAGNLRFMAPRHGAYLRSISAGCWCMVAVLSGGDFTFLLTVLRVTRRRAAFYVRGVCRAGHTYDASAVA
jgi:hypothetical protein